MLDMYASKVVWMGYGCRKLLLPVTVLYLSREYSILC